MSPLVLSYTAALSLVALVSWAWGDAAGRQAAFMYLAAQVATLAVDDGTFWYVATGPALVDALLLIGIIWTTLRHTRPWLIVLSTLQLVTVFGHLARATNVNVWPIAYAIMVQWTAWPSLIVVASGTWLDRKRVGDT